MRFLAHQAGSGGDQINVNALGNKPLKKNGAVALVASDIPNGAIIEAELDTTLTNFQILSVLGNGAVLGANTFTGLQTYNIGAGTLANLLISTAAGAALGPTMEVQRALTGVAGNLIGSIDLTGQSTTSVARMFARLQGKIITATNGAEDGEAEVWTVRGGTLANRLSIGAGLYTPNASGGDKGADTVNALQFYKNGAVLGGVPVTTKTADYVTLAADVGGWFKMNSASPHQFTVIAGATAGNGGQFVFESQGAGITTLARSGSDTFASGGATNLTSLQLSQGDKVTLTSDGGSPAIWSCQGVRHYDSGQQTITAGGSLTLPHGLGVQPLLMELYLHCTTAEGNYSINDEVVALNCHQLAGGDASGGRGVTTNPDATNLNIRFGSASGNFVINNKTSGAQLIATNANWKAIWRTTVTN